MKKMLMVMLMVLGLVSSASAASLVSGSANCNISNSSIEAKVNTDFAITKFHFVIYRPGLPTISEEQWGGFNQQIGFSKNNISLTNIDRLLIWDTNFTIYETIYCK